MLTGVGSVAVLVQNARKSAEWYRDVLDFEVVGDVGHTVYVRPKRAAEPLIHLCGGEDAWHGDRPGGRTGIWLHCGPIRVDRESQSGQVLPASDPDEVERTYRELKARGAEFSEELTIADWGKYAILRDPDGNEFEIG